MAPVRVAGYSEPRRLTDASATLGNSLVSVVIPCLNEATHFPSLLDALRRQDASLHEVIVVDNGSTDRTCDIVREYQRHHSGWPLRLMRCPSPGAAAAMNAGIGAATGDVIVRLDGHSVPRADYVRRATARLQEDGVGVVGGVWEIAPGRPTLVAGAIASVLSHTLGTGGAAYRHPDQTVEATDVDTVPFGCYRKALWEQLGGYNERLQVNEDYALNYKARRAGWRVLLDPAIRCTYFARSTFTRLVAQYFQYGWWKADMLKTYPYSVQWRQIVPACFAAALAGLAVLGFITGTAWVVLGGLILAYLLVLAIAAAQLARSRRAWLAMPAYVTAFCLVHLSWGFGACVNVITLGQWPTWSGSMPTVTSRERGVS